MMKNVNKNFNVSFYFQVQVANGGQITLHILYEAVFRRKKNWLGGDYFCLLSLSFSSSKKLYEKSSLLQLFYRRKPGAAHPHT